MYMPFLGLCLLYPLYVSPLPEERCQWAQPSLIPSLDQHAVSCMASSTSPPTDVSILIGSTLTSYFADYFILVCNLCHNCFFCSSCPMITSINSVTHTIEDGLV